ncbi:MAG: type IV pilus assembly protein PilM, partial [Actinobacteria bacterium]|nr:type IV pilus assembly protein PilM [Actinomycetota bacterium]
IPVEEAELDFHIVDEFQGEADARMLRLLLVAAHKDMVATHIAAAEEAGLRPTGVDLNPFALLRALASDSTFEAGGEMIIDVGAGVTNIVIHEAGVPKFVRILVLGGDDITDALAATGRHSHEDADLLKRRSGLSGGEGDDARIIDEQAGQFVDEVRNSLDYYQAQTGSSRITRVVLTGGGSLLTGLPERLSGAIRLPVEVGNPFDRWPVSKVEMAPEQLAQVGPVLTTSIGLALGGAE